MQSCLVSPEIQYWLADFKLSSRTHICYWSLLRLPLSLNLRVKVAVGTRWPNLNRVVRLCLDKLSTYLCEFGIKRTNYFVLVRYQVKISVIALFLLFYISIDVV